MAIITQAVDFSSGSTSLLEALGVDIPSNTTFTLFEGSFSDIGSIGDGGFGDLVSANFEYGFNLALDLVIERPSFGTFDINYPMQIDVELPDSVDTSSPIEISTSEIFSINDAQIIGTTVSLGTVGLNLDIQSSGATLSDISLLSTFFSDGFEIDRDLSIAPFDTTVPLATIDLGTAVEGEIIDGVTVSLGTPGGEEQAGAPLTAGATSALLPIETTVQEALFEVSANPLEVVDTLYPALDVLQEDFEFSLGGFDIMAEYSIFAPFIAAGYGIVQEYFFTPTAVTTDVMLDSAIQSGELGDSFSFDAPSNSGEPISGSITYGLEGTLQTSYSLAPIGSVGVTILGGEISVENETNDTVFDVEFGPVASPSISGSTDIGSLTLFTSEPITLPEDIFAPITQDFTIGADAGQDIAFVIDTTGSMFDDIDAVKASSNDIIEAAFDPSRGLSDSRVAIVEYNDPFTGVILPFTDQADPEARKQAALAAIDSISVGGGGDIPELTYTGLSLALNGSAGEWRPDAVSRKIILFGDAPAKDTDLRDSVIGLANNLGVELESALAASTVSITDEISLTTLSVAPAPANSISPVSVQIFTVAIGANPDTISEFEDIADQTGGLDLRAADATEIVDALLEVISLPIYTLSSDVVQLVEGDSGQVSATVTIQRDIAETTSIINLGISGTADPLDLVLSDTTVILSPGQTTATVELRIQGDLNVEADETATISISSISEPATITNSSVSIEILNDDTDATGPIILDDGASNINLDGAVFEFIDFGGNDTYTVLPTLSGDITVVDNNFSLINLPVGLEIESALFLSDGLQIGVDGSTITFLGSPSSFTFNFGGSPLDLSLGLPAGFELAAQLLGTTVPGIGDPANEATIVGVIQSDGSVL